MATLKRYYTVNAQHQLTNEAPRVAWKLRGVSFCHNRLVKVETSVLLNELVVNVASDDAGDHTDGKRRDNNVSLQGCDIIQKILCI